MSKKKFKTGDWIVALTTKVTEHSTRIEGEKYKVLAEVDCNECGQQMVMVSKKELSKSFKMKCGNCGCTDMQSNHPWVMACNFTSSDNIEERLKHAIASENYELAAQLRDQLSENNR
jgi:ribosomal protein S27AE